jgi:hypothetical protein
MCTVLTQVDDLIEKMSSEAGGIDAVTYTAMLGACMHDCRRAEQLLQEMKAKVNSTIIRTAALYSCEFSCCQTLLLLMVSLRLCTCMSCCDYTV